MPPAPIWRSRVYWPRRRTRAASVRRPKITRDPTVAIAIDTAHHVVTFTAAAADPPPANTVAGTSAAIDTALATSVRRGVLGTVIVRAITVFAHARSPA